jgi:hypothetical protein
MKVTVAPTWRLVKDKPLALGTAILSRVRCGHNDWAAAIWDQAVQWQSGALVVVAVVVAAVVVVGALVVLAIGNRLIQ